MSADGDYTFGRGAANFLKDSSQMVAQRVRTRLLLMTGEWFLDRTEGTDYPGRVLGKNTQGTYDQEFRQRILATPGVRTLLSYSSKRDGRALSVSATIDTIYSAVPVTISVGVP